MAKKKKKRTPVKKTTGGRTKKKTEVAKAETAAPKKTDGRKKKTPPKKDPPVPKIDFSGEHKFRISDQLKDRFQKVGEALGETDALSLLTKVFEAGVGSMEETLGSKASGNLVDDALDNDADDDNDAYDPEFEEAFAAQLVGGV